MREGHLLNEETPSPHLPRGSLAVGGRHGLPEALTQPEKRPQDAKMRGNPNKEVRLTATFPRDEDRQRTPYHGSKSLAHLLLNINQQPTNVLKKAQTVLMKE